METRSICGQLRRTRSSPARPCTKAHVMIFLCQGSSRVRFRVRARSRVSVTARIRVRSASCSPTTGHGAMRRA